MVRLSRILRDYSDAGGVNTPALKSLAENLDALTGNCWGLVSLPRPAIFSGEQSDWKRHALMRFRAAKLQDSYLDSLRWSQSVTNGLMI